MPIEFPLEQPRLAPIYIGTAVELEKPSNTPMDSFYGAICLASSMSSQTSLFLAWLPLLVLLFLAHLFLPVRFFPFQSSASQSIKFSCLIIEDLKKDRERCRCVRTYLANKRRHSSSAPITELPKPKNSKADQLEIEDTFDGMQLKWSLRSKEKEYKKLGFIPWRRKIQFFELFFFEGYQSRVDSAYLPYIHKEAEKKKLQWERIQALRHL